ncbi:MAG TPA: hypothetical protein VIX86_17495 [Streptosporangiaceae bacterium]
MLRAQAEEQPHHGDQVEDRDQPGDVRAGTTQPGQIAAEGKDHDEGGQRPRAAALGQPLRYLVRGALDVVAGFRPFLSDSQPQVVKLGRLLAQGHRFGHRRHVSPCIRLRLGPLVKPVVDEAGQMVDIDLPGQPDRMGGRGVTGRPGRSGWPRAWVQDGA